MRRATNVSPKRCGKTFDAARNKPAPGSENPCRKILVTNPRSRGVEPDEALQ